MIQLDDPAAPIPIPTALRDAQRSLWEHLASAGTWWSGEQRLAIAAEARNAAGCALCRARKDAVSPNAVRGRHESLGALPEHVVEVVHRIRVDPARLSRSWFDSVMDAGLDDMHYVELVSVVALLAGLDSFTRALGMAPSPFPRPVAGEPSRRRPPGAKPGTAWVATIAPEDATGSEADIYEGETLVPNIARALSLVPAEVRALYKSGEAHYLPMPRVIDPTARRSLDRMQMELVAARVSALNECFY